MWLLEIDLPVGVMKPLHTYLLFLMRLYHPDSRTFPRPFENYEIQSIALIARACVCVCMWNGQNYLWLTKNLCHHLRLPPIRRVSSLNWVEYEDCDHGIPTCSPTILCNDEWIRRIHHLNDPKFILRKMKIAWAQTYNGLKKNRKSMQNICSNIPKVFRVPPTLICVASNVGNTMDDLLAIICVTNNKISML